MKLKNTFVQGKMNKDYDERLIPKGQYPHGENIRVANSDGSDMGAIENVKGNEQLTSLGLTNAVTVGTLSDGFNEKLYWFVTSDEKDLLLEYEWVTSQLNILLESSNPDGILNLNEDYLITGISKIMNGDPDKDLLVWTDDYNPPRIINIKRAKDNQTLNGADSFVEDDISLIKKPPRYAPTTALTYSGTGLENNIENRFLTFGYRYKYLDGGYSAISSYSNYQFAADEFDLDYNTMENNGMVNSFNAINIGFDTGSKRVTDVQLIGKETNSNALFIIETFNKEEEGWGNDEAQTFLFANSKKYLYLDEDELFRAYDNVPKLAKSLENIGNRLVFGNYVEGFDLIDNEGEEVNIEHELEVIHNTLEGEEVPVVITNGTSIDSLLILDLSGIDLKAGTRLLLDISLSEETYDDGSFNNLFSFILNNDYANASDLAASDDFTLFIESILTNNFLNNNDATIPVDGVVLSSTPFHVTASTTATIFIQAPTITYEIDTTSSVPEDDNFIEEVSEWSYTDDTKAFFKKIGVGTSIKTNRSYEAGIIYLDEHNRATTVLTNNENTFFIPQEYAIHQNKLKVKLFNKPPVGADRYKIVIKQNKAEYQTIYTNIYYEDGVYRWVKLEGANKDKVKEGDTLIVKSDLGGFLEEPIKVRVLELSVKPANFLEDNETEEGNEISEEEGLYMKIKPSGFDMSFSEATARSFTGSSHLRYPVNTYTSPYFGEGTGVDFEPYPLSAGSSVRLYIDFKLRGSASYHARYDKTFRVNGDYSSIEEWFNEEVEDLGSFGDDYTRDYGFSADGSRFYVRAHRDGTRTRSVSTNIKFEILFSEGTVIFETEPQDVENNVFYETSQTFDIVDGNHEGNIQDQYSDPVTSGALVVGQTYRISTFNAGDDFTNVGASSNTEGEIFEATGTTPTTWTNSSVLIKPAVIESNFFNCYVQGNGAESYRYKDAFNSKFLNIDLRPSSTSVEKYKRVRRFADLTYSEIYNENTNLNGLNEFHLAKANYKEDLDKQYGFIQKLYSRDTDLVVFQEDKVSKVLFGKDLITNADGSSSLVTIEDVLGQQVTYKGEYGISRNPESFATNSYNVYFTDAKRGCVLRLGLNGLTEISKAGMTNYYRELYKNNLNGKKFGAFDPFYDQYIVYNEGDYPLTYDERIDGWTSFFTFEPEFMIGMNNNFFSFKNGDLYVHNSDNVNRNFFYGFDFPSKVSLMVNEEPSTIKEMQALSIEGNVSWNAVIQAYVGMSDDFIRSTIDEVEFVRKEGIWYAHTRRNESDSHYDSKSTYGIGVITDITGTIVTINGFNTSITSSDVIVNGSDLIASGSIINHSVVDNTTTLELTDVTGLSIGDFAVGMKDARTEGGNLRGYTIKIDLEVEKDSKVEMFAVNSEVIKSYS